MPASLVGLKRRLQKLSCISTALARTHTYCHRKRKRNPHLKKEKGTPAEGLGFRLYDSENRKLSSVKVLHTPSLSPCFHLSHIGHFLST